MLIFGGCIPSIIAQLISDLGIIPLIEYSNSISCPIIALKLSTTFPFVFIIISPGCDITLILVLPIPKFVGFATSVTLTSISFSSSGCVKCALVRVKSILSMFGPLPIGTFPKNHSYSKIFDPPKYPFLENSALNTTLSPRLYLSLSGIFFIVTSFIFLSLGPGAL